MKVSPLGAGSMPKRRSKKMIVNGNEKKDIQVNIRLNKKDYQNIKDFAKEKGFSISDAIRYSITHGMFGEENEIAGETTILMIPEKTKRIILIMENGIGAQNEQ